MLEAYARAVSLFARPVDPDDDVGPRQVRASARALLHAVLSGSCATCVFAARVCVLVAIGVLGLDVGFGSTSASAFGNSVGCASRASPRPARGVGARPAVRNLNPPPRQVDALKMEPFVSSLLEGLGVGEGYAVVVANPHRSGQSGYGFRAGFSSEEVEMLQEEVGGFLLWLLLLLLLLRPHDVLVLGAELRAWVLARRSLTCCMRRWAALALASAPARGLIGGGARPPVNAGAPLLPLLTRPCHGRPFAPPRP